LIETFTTERRAVGSRYDGSIGVPAIFPRAHFDRLYALEGDRGAKSLLRGDVVAIDWPDGAVDVDTEADVSRAPAFQRARVMTRRRRA